MILRLVEITQKGPRGELEGALADQRQDNLNIKMNSSCNGWKQKYLKE